MTSSDGVSPACTLPTAERPPRIAEFDDLFTTARRVERLAPTRARVVLAETGGVRARTEDLTARETACCSFFTFTITPAGPADLWLDVEVPAAQVAVLDGLLTRATA
ncbi:hypothetical protein [Cryptosporangium japonicum]|uniref:Uncharacterized protein n=1 Tax=Cryptosporangium japonicum TaxID=80872 RepID=A0ABP3DQW5_9ACTN